MVKGLLISVVSNSTPTKRNEITGPNLVGDMATDKRISFSPLKGYLNPLGLILVISSMLKDIHKGLCIDQYSDD